MNIEALLQLTPGERTKRLEEIASEVKKLESRIQVAQSDAGENSGFERRKEEYERTVKLWQDRLKDLLYRRENAPEIIDGCKELIETLKSEQKILKNADDIKKLLALSERKENAERPAE